MAAGFFYAMKGNEMEFEIVDSPVGNKGHAGPSSIFYNELKAALDNTENGKSLKFNLKDSPLFDRDLVNVRYSIQQAMRIRGIKVSVRNSKIDSHMFYVSNRND